MRYYEIIKQLGLEPWWGEFLRSNPSNTLPYHNFLHTTFMIEDAFEGAMAEGLTPVIDHPVMKALILAAMYHDWGHTGGVFNLDPERVKAGEVKASPDSVNIRLAVEKVKGMLKLGFWPCGVSLDQVINNIKATQFPYDIPAEDLTPSGRILRDADILTSCRDSKVFQCLFGLSREPGVPMDLWPELNKRFVLSIEQSTEWGKRRWAAALPQILEEYDAFIQAWNIGYSD